MENRNAKRITTGYRAEIICRGRVYEGTIDNLSEKGLSITTSPLPEGPLFDMKESVDIKFQCHENEMLTLHCRIKWMRKMPPHGVVYKIGMEIIDPPWEECKYFL